ncbi:MAG: septum site-determining protein MinD, partial [Candidatus Electrothrix sp. AS4_5]|nr:septum site-determining protein MinD [Candidatus Electrothrix gigas]
EILRVKLIGVIPESESVLKASNAGTPAIHLAKSDVAEAYQDVITRFLGDETPMRFTVAEKQGFFKRLLGGK